MGFKLPTLPVNIKTTPIAWVRPNDWPVITDAANEVQFLICDIGASQSTNVFAINTTYTRTGGENLYIDWGDGSGTTTVSTPTSVFTTHNYTPGSGTACSRGYTTFKIRIWTDAGATITLARNNYITRDAFSGGAVGQNAFAMVNPTLEAYYGDGVGDGRPLDTAGGLRIPLCEYVKMPSTFSSLTTMGSYFTNYYGLQKVILPNSAPNLIGMANAFQACYQLRGDIVIPPDAPITTFSLCFQNCYNISSFKWVGSGCASTGSMVSAFQNCYNLTSVELGSMLNCLSYNATFTNCSNLQSFKLGAWFLGSSGAVSFNLDMTSMFNNCYSLEYLSYPLQVGANLSSDGAVGGTLTGNNMFQNCLSLKTAILPHAYNSYVTGNLNTALWNCNNMFNGCSSLVSVYQSYGSTISDPTWKAPVMQTCTSMFQNCYELTTIQLSPVVSGSMTSMFSGCLSIKEIDMTGYNPSDITTCFSSCYQLKNIIFPATMNSLINMTSAFSTCLSLKSVAFPSMTSLQTATSAFSNCQTITSISLPATTSALFALSGAFQNCYNLQSITLPTITATACNMTNAFSGCWSLKTIVLPANMNINTTAWGTAFSNCIALETLTLPTTQITGSVVATGMLTNCVSLKTINNLDKLGNVTGTGVLSAFDTWSTYNLKSLTFPQRVSRFGVVGSANYKLALETLRFTNTSTGQWTGTSPQIAINYSNLSTASLVTLFNDLAAQGTVTSKTIDITGSTGAAGLSASDRLIITSKGWTITG